LAKGPEAFRTISEAADELGVPQHVLRFWETKFSFIRPMKRAGGRRFYRPQDLAVLKGVRALLHDEGYTIKGVQRLHKEEGVKRLLAAGQGERTPAPRLRAPVPEFDEGVLDQGAEGALEAYAAAPPPAISNDSLRDALKGLEAAKVRLNRALSNS
jgi:DNA-binding transcriptional MerR regulator